MQTKLEKRLSHLDAPTAPQNLQARCFETIPVPSVARSQDFQKMVRPLRANRLAVASVFLFAAVGGIAFLSTRPPGDGKMRSSGSIAFAQVIEASSKVTFFHAKDRLLATVESAPIGKEREHLGMWQSESWYDAEQGLYSQSAPEVLIRSRNIADLPNGASLYNRNLFLPSGMVYMRGSGSNTVLVVSQNAGAWRKFKNYLVSLLTDNVEGRTNFNHEKNGPILSSTTGSWKGQAAQILVFERQPNQFNASQGAHSVEVHFYVNPETKLVIAEQDFDTSSSATPTLVAESEFDYDKPDPATFDVQRLTEGATLSHDLKGITKQPSKSNSTS